MNPFLWNKKKGLEGGPDGRKTLRLSQRLGKNFTSNGTSCCKNDAVSHGDLEIGADLGSGECQGGV